MSDKDQMWDSLQAIFGSLQLLLRTTYSLKFSLLLLLEHLNFVKYNIYEKVFWLLVVMHIASKMFQYFYSFNILITIYNIVIFVV